VTGRERAELDWRGPDRADPGPPRFDWEGRPGPLGAAGPGACWPERTGGLPDRASGPAVGAALSEARRYRTRSTREARADSIRASADVRPSSSMDSNRGGEIRRPVMAARTGPKADLGFNRDPRPERSAERPRWRCDRTSPSGQGLGRGVQRRVGLRRQAGRRVDHDVGVVAEQEAEQVDDLGRVFIRSWTSGVAAASSWA
jgi:hypothetical protein